VGVDVSFTVGALVSVDPAITGVGLAFAGMFWQALSKARKIIPAKEKQLFRMGCAILLMA
jgi:hypothetical protein